MSWIFRSIPVVIYKLESCCKEMNLGLFSIVCGGQLLNPGGFAGFFFALLLFQSKTSFLFRKRKPIFMTATGKNDWVKSCFSFTESAVS